ncbi:chloride channel protein [Desulfosarcina sp. OttesenSCG-928-A07]|nr:chloride channel protein [Desulfosarcina sp. OttesenSCG-928-G17]MDL2329842.1 chloride channel protein [Desulfosarcina sp. OttesenSCG-928-A07]
MTHFFKLLKSPGSWPLFRSDDRLLLIVLAVVVGTCSGTAALLLNQGLEFMIARLQPFREYGWAIVLPGIGAALAAFFLNQIVRENPGHGIPEVIDAVSQHGGQLRLRSSFSRLVSGCLTIGSGGSAGPEAPVVMSGAAIGSNIARFFSLNDRQRVALVGCGAAGAISAIFNAPIAGMVFTVEVILGEWTTLNVIPIAIAAVAGTELSRALHGNQIAFAHRAFDIHFHDILACVGLAVFCAVISIVLSRSLRATHHYADRIPLPIWVRAFVGGCMVGGIGYVLPDILGEGYPGIRLAIDGGFPTGLLLVTGIALIKILSTAITLGSGGSGGIFAPCLVVGAFTGLSFHRLIAAIWPGVPWVNEGCFALLGMAGLVSGVMQAPLTGMFLIVEVTGGYGVILPLIVVSTISTTICHYVEFASFYLRDLVEQGKLLRMGTDARVLADLSVEEVMETDCIRLNPHLRLVDLIDRVENSVCDYFPVEDPNTGEFLGMIDLNKIRPYLFEPTMHHAVLVGQLMDSPVETVSPDDDLANVLKKMDDYRLFTLPVVSDGCFQGFISKVTLLDRYRQELRAQTPIHA